MNFRFRLLPAAALLFLSAIPALAEQLPWEGRPLSAEPKAMLEAAQKLAVADAPVTVLLDETRYRFEDDGTATSTEYVVYRVNEEAAVDDWSQVRSIWTPWYEDKPQIQARVITKDGTVHALDNTAVVEAPAPEESLDIFSDNRVIRAPLPAVAAGSVVERVITSRHRVPIEGTGISDAVYFGSWVPSRRVRLVIDAPESLAVALENRTSPQVEPVKQVANGRQTITLVAGPLDAIEHFAPNLPFDVSALPYVAFSTGKSWQQLATRYAAIVDKILDQQPLAAIAKEATAGAKTREQKISAVLAYVQKNVRYAGVEIGESSVIPRPPQTVLGNKYGDCKDKATLVVGLLRSLGIDADVALLRAGRDLDVNPKLPGMGRFNHAIVRVRGEKPMWIDPTDEFSRAGELPGMDEGRLALVANPSTTEPTLTPVSSAADNAVVETRTVTLGEEGKSSVTETSVSHGTQESMMRRYYASSERKAYREQVEGYVKSYYAAKSLKSLEATDPHDLAKPFSITIEAAESGRGVTDGGEAAVAINPAGLLSDLPWSMRGDSPHGNKDDETAEEKKKKERRHDFVFAPYAREWRYQIVPPPGYEPRPLPQNETVKLGTTTLTKKYETNSTGTVTATFRFDSGKPRLTPAELEETKKAIAEFDKSDAVIVAFDQVGQLKLSEGNVAAAIEEFKRLGALHPKEARHQTDIARALLAGGMGDAAREQIRKAIELEPTYAPAHRMQGIILQHDLFGRPYRKGFDRAGAIAAYRKAIELDRKNDDYPTELAKLLEYGTDGLLFGEKSEPEEAIKLYTKLIDDENKTDLGGELVVALVQTGRFAQLRERLPKLEPASAREMARVIAAAGEQGSAAALREAASLDNARRKEVLKTTGSMLISLRMYDRAADLLEAAMQGAPTTETRAQVELLRKMKRFETVTIPDDDPKSIVQKLLVSIVVKNLTAEQSADFFVSDLRPILTKVDQDEEDSETPWRTTRASLVHAAREQQLPLAFYADAAISGSTLTVDGDEATGYRVKSRSNGQGGDDNKETFFVVKDKGGYRLAASTKVPAMIGWNVLRLLDAKKEDAARQWLNWAREDIQGYTGDDPLPGIPFTRLWSRGKQTASADEMRLAAAALMLSKDFSPRAIEILTAAREKASDSVRDQIDISLMLAYLANEDDTALEPVARRLAAQYPDSDTAFNVLVGLYTRKGDYTTAQKLANDRLTRIPKDREAIRAMANAEMRSGDYAKADKHLQQIVKELSPTFNDYNNAAWNALFTGTDLQHALEDARQAISMSGNASSMHTLAALYAETGKSLEAREALLQSMDVAGREEPASHDWYVLGRIAESYGAKDAALSAYRKVEKPKSDDGSDTYVLAVRRLKALGAK